MSFGRAVFAPNHSTLSHIHPDMTEVFFIILGKGIFHTETEKIVVEKDDFICIPLVETNLQSNPF